jgi:molybdopterin molybdotransferase
MISYEKARQLVFKSAITLPTERVFLSEALGRIIAQDVKAPHPLPPFNNSAMDGFALRSEDVKGKPPFKLQILGEEPAGRIFEKEVFSGRAVKIMTGAPLPKGADAVIPIEEVREEEGSIVIEREVEKWENVRFSGEDVKEGEVVIKKGEFLNSSYIGLLAALGCASVEVYARPQVGIIATGEELREVWEPLSFGAIRNSNTYALVAQVRTAGAVPVDFGRVGDELEETVEILKEALSVCEIVLTTGGVSVGQYDLVKEAFEKVGGERVFWKVAQKPAKPLAFYLCERGNERRFLFGLPGNPGAVMVSFEEYVRPLINLMMGRRDYLPEEFEAKLLHDFKKKKGRLNFLRVRLKEKNGEIWVESVGGQGSGILKTLVQTEALALIPAEEDYLPAGTKVKVHLVRW